MRNQKLAKTWIIALLFLFGLPALLISTWLPYLDIAQAGFLEGVGNKHEEALRLYDRAIRAKPDLAAAYAGRGHCHYNMGDMEKATQQFTKAVELEPTNAESWNMKAWILAKMGQNDQAIADATKSLELQPHPNTFDTRAYAYMHQRKYDEALKDFNSALKLDPKFGDAHFHRSQLYAQTGKNDLAEADKLKAKEFGYTGDDETTIPPLQP